VRLELVGTSRRAASVIVVVSLLATAGGCTGVPGLHRSGPADPSRATVDRVVDGDTVDLRFASGTERVRLLGIDTPETVKPNTPVQCFGPEASARAKVLLPRGATVRVERDAEARDRYGRLLLYVYRSSDGMFVNRTLAAEGYARVLSISPNTAHATDIRNAAAAADRAGRGLWSRCPTPTTPP
jgi:micrococcal nuclease